MNSVTRFLLVLLFVASSIEMLYAQDVLRFKQPLKPQLQGTVDVELAAPADTSAIRLFVDDTQTSELTDEYATATKTPPLWHTVLATEWFTSGAHTLRAIATTSRGTLTVSMSVSFVSGSDTQSLNGSWRFASADELPIGMMEGATPAVAKPEFDDSGWQKVVVPNSVDAVDQRWMRASGVLGAYRRAFTLPADAMGQELYLKPESCFWSCRYFVNGTEVGSASGGYLPRQMRVTPFMHAGMNSMAIVVDSRASTMGIFNRLRYYYWNYSGLLQNISLQRFEAVTITEFRAQGSADGTLTIIPEAVSVLKRSEKLSIVLDVIDDGGRAVHSSKRDVVVPVGGGHLDPIRLMVEHAELWDLDHPHLYTVVMRVQAPRGESVLSEKTGFRDIVVRDGDLLLNGKPVLGLQGFNRHGDYPGLGKSQPDGLADREIKLLHDKGFRIFRPAHYPTTKAELDAADKYGMLVLEEINVTGMSGEQLKSPEVLNFAKSQLDRMIGRDRSHPSVFGWSIGNENRTDQAGSEIYVRDMIAYGKTLDTTRPFTEVSAQLRHDICYPWMDFLAVNIYAGWYTDKLSDVVPELDALAAYAGNKPMVITEYGAEGVENRAGTGKGSEYFQALTVDVHNRLLCNRPHFIGKMYWTSTEFIVGPKWEGGNPDPVPPFHTKGLLTYYRQPKLAWRVMFSPVEMDEVAPIEVNTALPTEQTIHIVLRNREARAVSGRLLVTPPAGATVSVAERSFSLAAGSSTELSFHVKVDEIVRKPNGYGMVRAVIDAENEAMPELLHVHASCGSCKP